MPKPSAKPATRRRTRTARGLAAAARSKQMHAEKQRKLARSKAAQPLLSRFRRVCLALPDATEVVAWGHPTFRVRGKIFASCGGDDSGFSIGIKTTHEMQAALVESDPRFTVAAYVGKHGWLTMSLKGAVDWDEVDALVRGSYRLIAPASLAAKVPDPRS